jgi:cyclopropane fatty-acyl-phospholipid synthase-like methyltransferase
VLEIVDEHIRRETKALEEQGQGSVAIPFTLECTTLTEASQKSPGSLALTLHHWVRRLEAHADEVRRITDETTYRIWRLYMAASAHRFRLNRLNLYQMTTHVLPL